MTLEPPEGVEALGSTRSPGGGEAMGVDRVLPEGGEATEVEVPKLPEGGEAMVVEEATELPVGGEAMVVVEATELPVGGEAMETIMGEGESREEWRAVTRAGKNGR